MSLIPTYLNAHRILALTMAVSLLLPLTTTQTQPAQQQPQPGAFRFRVETEIVLVNAVARDKQGKPVTDLKAEDFTLLEDGKPQHIVSFDYENLDTTPLASPA